MNHTHLFSIEWDNSYNDPDFAVPGTFGEWIQRNPECRERLAKQFEWMAKAMREGTAPFQSTVPNTVSYCCKCSGCNHYNNGRETLFPHHALCYRHAIELGAKL